MEEYLDGKIVAQRDSLLPQENSSIDEGLSIGDAFYEFEPVELFEGTFNIMLPTSFVDMPLCAAKAKYPSDDRPQVIKCSMDSEINFAFHLLSEILPEESVIMETEALRQMLQRIQPANLFYECALEPLGASSLGWFDYKGFALSGQTYNLMFIAPIGGKIMLGSFQCGFDDAEQWKPAVREVLLSIRDLPDDNKMKQDGGIENGGQG